MPDALVRNDFSLGWQPNRDNVNCPVNALLRMDNCVLDEVGAVTKRLGSSKLTQTGASDTDVASLFTTYIDGTRYRMAGASSAVYANGSSIASSVAGTGDINFTSFLDEIFFARSTTKKKYDGTTVRTWGIAGPAAAPSNVTLSPPDVKTFASCDSTESPGFTTPSEGTLSFSTDWDGTASKALQIIPDATTARGMATLTYASPEDFTDLDGGDTGTEHDRISMHCYVDDPANLTSVTFMVDVDDGSFSNNYYSYTWFNKVDQINLAAGALTGHYDPVFAARQAAQDALVWITENRNPFRQDLTSWNYIWALRRFFTRYGLDLSTKDWTTVKAIRVLVNGTATVKIDTVELKGGEDTPLDGKYKWRALYVLNNGRYNAKSTVSDASVELEVYKGAAEVSVANPATSKYSAADVSANKVQIWVYRNGGLLNGWYRTATATVTASTGNEQIVDSMSDVDALELNIRLDTTNTNPPDSIIGMIPDYYDRLIAITADTVYPSRRLDPDSFSSNQTLRTGDGSYVNYWIAQANDACYIGTDKDIIRLRGTGDELPDDTVDFFVEPLNIAQPPISKAFAQDGNTIVYLAADGWRLFTGNASVPITNDVNLLYRGHTRHGVSPVNISDRSARFRACINKGQFIAITCEGSDTGSPVLHRYDIAKQRWYRHTYDQLSTNDWKSIFSEPDGTLIAGDNNRNIWILDTGTQDDSNNIAIVIWTPVDADGKVDQAKDAHDLRVELDTGNVNATFAMHKDGSGSSTNSHTIAANGFSAVRKANTDFGRFYQAQMRITGSFGTFRLLNYTLFYYLNPATRLVWDSGAFLDVTELFWIREIHFKADGAADFTVTPYVDDTASTAYTATAVANKAKIYQVKLGRGVKGSVPRVRITSTSAFIPHWVEVIGTRSGMTQERLRITA